MDYLVHLGVVIAIYSLASIGLDFFIGRSGVLSACQAALMGVGAYTSAILTTRVGAPWWVACGCAVMFTGLLAPVVGLFSIRARGDYFILATLAVQAIFFNAANSWDRLTGGPFGLRDIPEPTIFGRIISQGGDYLILCTVLLAVVAGGVIWLEKTAFLPSLRGGRDDQVLLASSGKNWARLRLDAYAMGGGLAGLAGCLLAHYVTFIDATTFSLEESVFLLTIVLVGGLDRVWGPILGAIVLTGIPEALRSLFPGLAMTYFLRTGIGGLLLVLIVLTRPAGLVGRYSIVPPRYE